ncbi:dihydrodipicolinate synthase family protein [Stenotrophomonas sp. S41]|uniref:dihydrodipicolinate synthase family protein n=1 Tax=Stenotrophomonas sp. S41 TaxID=2767464 RepID=UPI00190A7272|nr:dihydrodipicolinate synthase family protein [Stenotrophomonas sp. S41]MBK0011138.1 dihydrodipicolinate synthase family protein [Stenotrophomonas sp. S41]
MNFSGLSAFPLTVFSDQAVDLKATQQLVRRLADAKVDSIGVLGSTGSYAYLTLAERKAIAAVSISEAGSTPVIVGVGALRTKDAVELAVDAQRAGASGLLLAPVSYQPLNDTEVLSLYRAVTDAVALPLCVYDNPGTTHFRFTDELLGEIANLPNVASIKIPPLSGELSASSDRIKKLRNCIPSNVTLGISGDHSAALGLAAGCDAWYSVIGGLFPITALKIVRLSQSGQFDQAKAEADRLAPLWALFAKHGASIRVIASAAGLLGLCGQDCLPLPLSTLKGADLDELAQVLQDLALS